MTQDGGEMERIREDLIRRARMERQGDIEQGISEPTSQPEMQDSHREEARRFHGLSTLPRFWRRGQTAQPQGDATEGVPPKSPDPRVPTIRIQLPNLSRTRTREHAASPSTPGAAHPTEVSPITPGPTPTEGAPLTYPSSPMTRAPAPAGNDGQAGRERRDQGSQRSETTRSRRRPQKFLFCFPLVKSKRIRSHMLRCFVSGVFLGLLLAVYLGLAVSRRIQNGELTIILILVILLATVFFCYSLLRLCMFVLRGDRERMNTANMHRIVGTGAAYAIPSRPIPVVLAQDEEAAGVETKATPPAYGLWRESVRVDPNRIFWQRNSSAEPMPTQTATGPRPPSYVSEDGVAYIMEAVPRSTAPTTEVPMPVHPSERGRAVETPTW